MSDPELNPHSLHGRALNPLAESAGFIKPRELRRLESRFPGVERNPDVVAIFTDPDTGRVEAIDLRNNEVDSVYLLGGARDFRLGVREMPKNERMVADRKVSVGPFFEVGYIEGVGEEAEE